MLKAATIAVVVALAAGCAGNARPVDPTDVPARDDVPAGMRGETGGVAELPTEAVPAATRADLEAVPLPDGVRPDDFDISLQYNRRIAYWLEYYQKYHTTFGSWLERMSRYEPLIRRELTDAGLPGDLIYLALIESGFTPSATSSARAVGIWQFMKETARMEGLEVSTYIDERRDPVRATAAAVHHLRALYRELGSWYLVAAAYNSGSGRIARALDANAAGARGADSLFWSIEPVLPRETRDYVPQFVAATILGKYPERFGVAPESLPGPDDYETVRISQATDLAAVAQAARVSEDVVRRLNPQFFRGVTPPGRTVSVRVPEGHADNVLRRLAAMPRRQRVHDLRHIVGPDETPQEVANLYGIQLTALRKANHLKKRTRQLAEGRVLTIPLVPTSVLAREESGEGQKLATSRSRKAQTDDSPAADAESRSGTRGARAAGEGERAGGDNSPAVDETDRDAGDRGTSARASTRDRASGSRTATNEDAPRSARSRSRSRSAAADEDTPKSARARSGRIAAKDDAPKPAHARSSSRAAEDNDAPRSTRTRSSSGGADDELIVSADRRAKEPTAAKASTSGRKASSESVTDKKASSHSPRVYRVKSGDTLWHIAHEHGISVERLRALNGMAPEDVIHPGETLRVAPAT